MPLLIRMIASVAYLCRIFNYYSFHSLITLMIILRLIRILNKSWLTVSLWEILIIPVKVRIRRLIIRKVWIRIEFLIIIWTFYSIDLFLFLKWIIRLFFVRFRYRIYRLCSSNLLQIAFDVNFIFSHLYIIYLKYKN